MQGNLILIVDDDSSVRRVMQMQLAEAGYDVLPAATGSEAHRLLIERRPKLVITDLRMPDLDGIELLRRIAESEIQTTVIMITAFGSIETAVQAMRLGAYDYITKPIDYEALTLAVHRAMERQNLIDEVRNLRSALDQRYGFENIVGHSKSLLRVLEMASRVAQHDTTVLVNGETGTGKELLARAIHHNSRRRNQPFVTINCGAIPKDLIEAELFGYARGAFTGASNSKPGKVEMADGGTLFLDEIGELPLSMQAKLLRFLQNGEVQRLGSPDIHRVDVRVVCATNQRLEELVRAKQFREDLYYRLAVFPIAVPPLRERRPDIALLARHFLEQLAAGGGFERKELPAEAELLLERCAWSGNVRELENAIERAFILSGNETVLRAEHFAVCGAPAN